MVILLTLILRTSSGVTPDDLAIVKDMKTCQTLAEVLNRVLQDDPDAAVICREVRPSKA